MKKFLQEFKKFITRGNVMDMAVGTIVGAAFTAIVTALSNGILKPLINTVLYYCFGGNSDALEKMYTMLIRVNDAEGNIDLANSIYIDWGAFISAIINFLLVAFVLFLIIKAFNSVKDAKDNLTDTLKRAEMKQEKGLKLTRAEKKALEEKAKIEEEARLAEEKAKLEAEKEPTPDPVVVLLQEIRDQLKNNK